MQTTPLVLVQTTSVEPSYYRQTQGAAASAATKAVIVHEDPDTHKAQESTKPAPRKTAAAKLVFEPPKRAVAPSNQAASPRTASVTDPATMAGQVQVHEPEQAGSVVAVAAADQIAPCTKSMALLYTSPSGVRFKPTNEELIFYLRLKHAGVQKMPVDFFKEVDVYHVHQETTKALCGESLNGYWYVFSPRNRKYKNGKRPARSVFEARGEQVAIGSPTPSWRLYSSVAKMTAR
ncbi:hypothetical protein BAE44_0020573 [Dichanthelium oligosanthes]|uniref:NAC domain-containing protein n=1 Tax=Dichanthelium oligosanthes TaxID=888268 RepID=A0A1E5UZZ3_9POAL|nr:hypothetical protein BAE44_0020573 [Dichanthelium oligosanthes]